MKHTHIFLILFALFLYSCSPAATASPPPDQEVGYLLDTKTGIEDVDNVLAAVASGNSEALHALIRYTVAPCTKADGLGGPPKCREGEAEGTLLEVLPFIGSEGGHMRKDEISTWQGVGAERVYAVYRVSETALNEKFYPAGEYLVIFTPQEGGEASILRLAKGGIVRVDTVFGEFPSSLETIIERDTSEVILPPEIR